jgi:predicted glycosyltransferase
VLVPFAADGETEQTRRAALLDERGLAVAVSEEGLDAGRMAGAIKRALTLPLVPNAIDLDGAPQTAAILRRLAAKRSSG